MSSPKRGRKRKLRPRIKYNHLARHIEKRIRQNKFIRYMFKTYGVPCERLQHIHVRNCLHEEHLAETESTQSGHYYIDIHYKIACPEWFHVVVHEVSHVLRMMTNTQSPEEVYWNYYHNPEEQECMLWEIRYFKSLGVRRERAIRRILTGIRWARGAVEIWWDLEGSKEEWKNEIRW